MMTGQCSEESRGGSEQLFRRGLGRPGSPLLLPRYRTSHLKVDMDGEIASMYPLSFTLRRRLGEEPGWPGFGRGEVIPPSNHPVSSGPQDRRAAVALALGGQPVVGLIVMNYRSTSANTKTPPSGWTAFLTNDQLMLSRNSMPS